MGMQKLINMDVTMPEDLWPTGVVNVIQQVMEEGEAAGKTGWKEESAEYHVRRAIVHMCRYLPPGLDAPEGEDDHLAHAFTRLMMALAMERGEA